MHFVKFAVEWVAGFHVKRKRNTNKIVRSIRPLYLPLCLHARQRRQDLLSLYLFFECVKVSPEILVINQIYKTSKLLKPAVDSQHSFAWWVQHYDCKWMHMCMSILIFVLMFTRRWCEIFSFAIGQRRREVLELDGSSRMEVLCSVLSFFVVHMRGMFARERFERIFSGVN